MYPHPIPSTPVVGGHPTVGFDLSALGGLLKDGGGIGSLIGTAIGGPAGSLLGGLADSILSDAGARGRALREGGQPPASAPQPPPMAPPLAQPYLPTAPPMMQRPAIPTAPPMMAPPPMAPQPTRPEATRVAPPPRPAEREQRVQRVQREQREIRRLRRSEIREIIVDLQRGLRQLKAQQINTVLNFLLELQDTDDPVLLKEGVTLLERLEERASIKEQILQAAREQTPAQRPARRKTTGAILEPTMVVAGRPGTTGGYVISTGVTGKAGCATGTCWKPGQGGIY